MTPPFLLNNNYHRLVLGPTTPFASLRLLAEVFIIYPYYAFNPFLPNVSFLYIMKTSEKLRGSKKGILTWNILSNSTLLLLRKWLWIKHIAICATTLNVSFLMLPTKTSKTGNLLFSSTKWTSTLQNFHCSFKIKLFLQFI